MVKGAAGRFADSCVFLSARQSRLSTRFRRSRVAKLSFCLCFSHGTCRRFDSSRAGRYRGHGLRRC